MTNTYGCFFHPLIGCVYIIQLSEFPSLSDSPSFLFCLLQFFINGCTISHIWNYTSLLTAKRKVCCYEHYKKSFGLGCDIGCRKRLVYGAIESEQSRFRAYC